MVLDLVETPQRRPDRLAAELLRKRDAHRLGLAVGVVRADAEPEPVRRRDDDRLGLARGVGTEHLEPLRLRQVCGRNAVVHRHRRRARHADRGELLDVVAKGGLVAAGPAGDDERVDVGGKRRRAGAVEGQAHDQGFQRAGSQSAISGTAISIPMARI